MKEKRHGYSLEAGSYGGVLEMGAKVVTEEE